MKRRFICAALTLACLSAVGSSQSSLRLGTPDWTQYAPREPFAVHRFYANPYTEVIYIADVVYLHDGTPMLAVENIKGRWCKGGRGCLIPVTQQRGVFVELEATIGATEQP